VKSGAVGVGTSLGANLAPGLDPNPEANLDQSLAPNPDQSPPAKSHPQEPESALVPSLDPSPDLGLEVPRIKTRPKKFEAQDGPMMKRKMAPKTM
jgi:hypothetical protein